MQFFEIWLSVKTGSGTDGKTFLKCAMALAASSLDCGIGMAGEADEKGFDG